MSNKSALLNRLFAAAGSLIITIILMSTAIVPASPAATFAQGVLA
ncbi:MAG: hypothetical protein V2J51_10200 [Erythrobacter sp.]|nr:hypothetical protein [Erythrobacter sp.]